MKLTSLRLKLAALVTFTMLVGCGQGPVEKEKGPVVINNTGADAGAADLGAPDGGGDVGGAVDLGGPTSDPDGPEILELSASPDRITQGQTSQVTVAVTDPQGFADIGGGRLLDGSDSSVVGLFQGAGGSFSFPLSWDVVNGHRAITFETEETRTYSAEFFDAADNRGRQSFALTLHCDGEPACEGTCGSSFCDGQCVDQALFADDEENCGACGNRCDGTFCVDGECTDCEPSEEHAGGCDPYCQTGCEAGEACALVGDPGSTGGIVCVPAGTGTQGSACGDDMGCAAGFSCLQTNTGPTGRQCLQHCREETEPTCDVGQCAPLPGVGVCIE